MFRDFLKLEIKKLEKHLIGIDSMERTMINLKKYNIRERANKYQSVLYNYVMV